MSWQHVKEKFGRDIIQDLYNKGMIRTWYRDNPEGWTLVSGLWSPFYIQLRPLSSYPELLKTVGHALGQLIKHEIGTATKCVGIAMAGIPIAIAIALQEGIPAGFTRKLEGVRSVDEMREYVTMYGEHALVEGVFDEGDTLVLVDDLVTQFDSKLLAIEQVKYELVKRKVTNATVENVVVLLDREQGAERSAHENRVQLHSLIPLKTKGLPWLAPFFDTNEYEVLTAYLDDPYEFQNQKVQTKLRKIARNTVIRKRITKEG